VRPVRLLLAQAEQTIRLESHENITVGVVNKDLRIPSFMRAEDKQVET